MKYLLPALLILVVVVGVAGLDPVLIVTGAVLGVISGILAIWIVGVFLVLVVFLIVLALLATAELVDRIFR